MANDDDETPPEGNRALKPKPTEEDREHINFELIRNEIKNVRSRIRELESHVDQVDTRVDMLKERLAMLEEKITEAEKTKVVDKGEGDQ